MRKPRASSLGFIGDAKEKVSVTGAWGAPADEMFATEITFDEANESWVAFEIFAELFNGVFAGVAATIGVAPT
jgi:hypothetical protein